MRVRRAMGIAVSAVVVTAVGCGDDEDGIASATGGDADLRQEYVDALVEVTDEAGAVFTVEEHRCMVESFVDGLGVDALDEAGVTPDDIRNDPDTGPEDLGFDFSGEQAADFYDRLWDCMDLRAFFIEGMGAGATLPDEVIACLDENISDDMLERVFTRLFTEGEDAFDDGLDPELENALSHCPLPAGE